MTRGRGSVGRLAWLWLPVVIWMVLIFLGSSRPDVPVHHNGVADLVLKKSAHIIEYAALGLLLWRAWRGSLGQRRAVAAQSSAPEQTDSCSSPSRLTVVVGALYAASDEVHQVFVANRHGRLADVALDVVAILMALAVVWLWEQRRRAEDKG